MSQSVERFSTRVENYIKYRPGYPVGVLDLLKTVCNLTAESVVADIGSGTGKLTEILLANVNRVFAIEPNAAMREAAERILKDRPGFKSIAGSAESTTLPSSSVDIVTAGQAFHWFDPVKTRIEWERILRPNGWAVLVWNERELQTTPFLSDYEQLLLEFGTDYREVRHDNGLVAIENLFAPERAIQKRFPNAQAFDFDGLKGRLLSSSYTPEPNHPKFEAMLQRLEILFDKHQENGYVTVEYQTKVFYGRLSDNYRSERLA